MSKGTKRHPPVLKISWFWSIVALLCSCGLGIFAENIPSTSAANVHTRKAGQNCTAFHRKPFFGGAVVVSDEEVICSDLTTFGGTTVVQGEVHGNVISFGGSVVIDGRVDGDITLYGGELTLQKDAHVNGDVHVCGGQWNEDKASQLHGNFFDCTRSVSQFVLGDGSASFRFWSTLIWVLLAVLLTTFLPENVMLVRTTIKGKMRRSLILGLLSMLLAPAVLTILVALIVAIPLAIIIAIGLIAGWTLGTVAVGWIIGEYFLQKIAPHQNTRAMQVVTGAIILAIASSIPYVGWFISIGAGMLGLGAVLLSRFGTRLYAQPRQPLSW